MALPAGFLSSLSSFIDPRAAPNLLHNRNGNSPLTLPATAKGQPPAVAVPNATEGAAADGAGDSVSISGSPAARSDGSLALDGSGIYRLVQASQLQLSARTVSAHMGSAVSAGTSSSGRGALGALSAAVGDSTAAGSGAMGRLRDSLEKLGLGDRSVRDLLLVGGMIEKLDPEAFEKFVQNIEAFAQSAGAGSAGSGVAAPSAAGATQPPAAGSQAGSQSFELHYVSVSISISEVTARTTGGGGEGGEAGGGSATEVTARSFELRFERLEISMSRQGAGAGQQGDPVVLDVNGDGLDLRPTSDGVLFDLTGSGRPVRTAFVQGDDGLLFYDANANGVLDDGSELVGNRVPGLDGMAELLKMDADGDGRVTALDPLWAGLRIFQDWNGDGQSTPDEVKMLDALGIDGLSALWERADSEDGEGLRRAGTSSFTRADGTAGLMLDYLFGYRPI